MEGLPVKKISSALTILESPDEVADARARAAQSYEDCLRAQEVLDRIVTPRAASQAPRNEPRIANVGLARMGCRGCTNEAAAHDLWCPEAGKP